MTLLKRLGKRIHDIVTGRKQRESLEIEIIEAYMDKERPGNPYDIRQSYINRYTKLQAGYLSRYGRYYPIKKEHTEKVRKDQERDYE